jgi:hypothetical protein
MEEIYIEQIKCLKTMYEESNKEIGILNKIIEFLVPEEYYKVIRAKAIKEMEDFKND